MIWMGPLVLSLLHNSHYVRLIFIVEIYSLKRMLQVENRSKPWHPSSKSATKYSHENSFRNSIGKKIRQKLQKVNKMSQKLQVPNRQYP